VKRMFEDGLPNSAFLNSCLPESPLLASWLPASLFNFRFAVPPYWQIGLHLRREQRCDYFFRSLRAHVQHLSSVRGQIGVRLVKQTFHRTWEAGCDLDAIRVRQPHQRGIFSSGHFTQVRHRLERSARLAKFPQDRLFDVAWDYLRVLAVAIEDAGRGIAHERRTRDLTDSTRLAKGCTREFARYENVGLGVANSFRHGSPMRRIPSICLAVLAMLLASGCASRTYTYRYIPDRTATVQNGYAVAPESAPPAVHSAIAAGNQIAGSTYARGGGHGLVNNGCFDCSGATSHVLRSAGLLKSSMPSRGFRKYGQSGDGHWISVWARKGHVFLVVAGLRFDTGWNGDGDGPRWTTKSRPARGYVIRHPSGL
jgi:hypothetical protein